MQDSKSNADRASRRALAIKLALLTFPPLIFAVGFWGMWPYLSAEHARLRDWEIPMFWLGEATAFVWYVAYVVSLLTDRLQTEPTAQASTARLDREYLWFLFLLCLGISADIGVGVWSMLQEREGLARAVPVVAQVEAGSVNLRPKNASYELHCRFVDAKGDTYTARFQPSQKDIPEKVKQAIDRQKFPVDIDLTYDPERPSRCWIRDASNPAKTVST